MFEKSIGNTVFEVSHKRIEHPQIDNYQNHIHNFCEALLFIGGDADFNIDGHIYRPKPYDLFLIPPGTYHYIIPSEAVPYENYVIDFASEIVSEKHYERIFTPPYRMNIRSDNEFIRYFTTLDKYSERYDEEDFSECTLSLIKQMLVYCSYQPKTHPSDTPHNKLIRSVVEYVSENLTEPLNAERISKQFFISPSYLQNTFSSVMHIGLKQYILQKKIFAARADMEKGASPGEVCKKYQFNDYTGFYRLYKKHFGSAPKEIFSDTET